jgi:CBS domain-containing protein
MRTARRRRPRSRVGRSWEILRLLTPFVFAFLRDRRRWILFGRPRQLPLATHEKRATRIVDAIARLGPTFIKLVQVFSSRADIIPELEGILTTTDFVNIVAESHPKAETSVSRYMSTDVVTASAQDGIRDAALHSLGSLAGTTGETAHLAVLYRGQVCSYGVRYHDALLV